MAAVSLANAGSMAGRCNSSSTAAAAAAVMQAPPLLAARAGAIRRPQQQRRQHQQRLVPAHTTASSAFVVRAAPAGKQPGAAGKGGEGDDDADEAFEGLLPEEDFEVPGTYFDALNRNTKLGKAVAAAIDELEHLGGMERETLSQAEELLSKLGIKGAVFKGAEQQQPPASTGAAGGDGESAEASDKQ